MPACPACETEVDPPAVECPRCHLAVALFEAVREAVGVETTDPRYTAEVHELLRAVDTEPAAPAAAPPSPGPADLSYPLRFPGIDPPRPPEPDAPAPPSLDGLPALPALPSGGIAGLRRQVEDYLRLARAIGLDLSDVVDRNKEAIAVDDRATLERLSRELFVRIAAVVAEEFEGTIALRNGIATVVNTAAEDAELTEIRTTLLAGDLAGSHDRLVPVRERLVRREEEHHTGMILAAECDLLAQTIRELGGDPGPALGPLNEGRRLLREKDPADAEPVLASASVALWAVLYPRLAPELRTIKERMIAQRGAGGDVTEAVRQLRDVAGSLKHRNFAGAIASYRRLRKIASDWGPAAPSATPAASG